jgi:hypothetical protein
MAIQQVTYFLKLTVITVPEAESKASKRCVSYVTLRSSIRYSIGLDSQ